MRARARTHTHTHILLVTLDAYRGDYYALRVEGLEHYTLKKRSYKKEYTIPRKPEPLPRDSTALVRQHVNKKLCGGQSKRGCAEKIPSWCKWLQLRCTDGRRGDQNEDSLKTDCEGTPMAHPIPWALF